ncbi:Uncharacterized protein C1orf77-like [Cricetulus griseus]|uniref:Uncharacterized protein C1orf77-like n=1 Tax=Cricetulus griseus TaxID=10029 RepID=G3INW7_CRIGR|nr:Uncharacterized protein C1orf77-like [Cricetulus griseus]
MATQSAPKVVLKRTTMVSLNDRFTNMLKNKQPMPVDIRASMQPQEQQQLASARNRRLTLQMDNRPYVQAVLNLKQSSKQRLGKSNIQTGLGRPKELDNLLDAYMSKTKGHLDAELDAYMAQTDPETND